MPLVAVLVAGSAVIAVIIQTCSAVLQKLMMLESYMNKRDQRNRWRAEMKQVSRDKKAETGH